MMSCWLSSGPWPFGPSWTLRRPMLGSMLAVWAHLGPILMGPSWAHVGGYVGPSWGLCWRMLDRKTAQDNEQLKAHQTWPKNALASGLRGVPERPGQPRGAQKRAFVGNLKNIGRRRPNTAQQRSDKSIQNPSRAATSEKSCFLGPPWPLWAPCWPLLGAM